MRTFGSMAALVAVALAASPARAGIRPSFYLDYSVWKATHIVLATEGDRIDGRFEVIESWKGDLEPGARVRVPELAVFADEGSRRIGTAGDRAARHVTGARMVLFLVRPELPGDGARHGAKPSAWLPASYAGYGGFEVSVAWIEDGTAYAFVQVMNPGPSVLISVGTEAKMEARVRAFCERGPREGVL